MHNLLYGYNNFYYIEHTNWTVMQKTRSDAEQRQKTVSADFALPLY